MEKYDKNAVLEKVMIDHGSELVRLAFAYVKDKETAKDMVQNTFIKCYENLDTFRYDAKLKTWLYRITINQCKDYLKSWHYKKIRTMNFIEDTTSSLLPSAENTVVEKSSSQEMKELIFSLPDTYREVIYLYYYNSLKIEEIAEITGFQANTVKTRLRRGKQKLKSMIEGAELYG